MIVGLILAGSIVAGGSALAALLLGQPVWMALLIYSAVGVASVLAGAAMVVWRSDPKAPNTAANRYHLTPPQRG